MNIFFKTLTIATLTAILASPAYAEDKQASVVTRTDRARKTRKLA